VENFTAELNIISSLGWVIQQESALSFKLAVSAYAKFTEGRRNYLRWLFATQVLGQIAQIAQAYVDIRFCFTYAILSEL
jgi:hypothetical protein